MIAPPTPPTTAPTGPPTTCGRASSRSRLSMSRHGEGKQADRGYSRDITNGHWKPFREEPGLAQQDSPGAAAALRAHGQGGYFVSASGVSAPPYGRQEPGEVVVEQLLLRGA